MQLKSFLQNEIVSFPHLILMANFSYNANKIVFILFNTSRGIFFSLKHA